MLVRLAEAVRIFVGLSIGMVALAGCAPSKEGAVVPVEVQADTLVRMDGPEVARRADSSVVVVETEVGMGTAFMVDTLGLLVTNRHVVEGVERVRIRSAVLPDTAYASVVFTSPACDLAILRVIGVSLPVLPIDREQEAQVGEHVFSIGHPLRLEYTISEGVVSGVRREAGQSTRIQFTAPISPGSSGGPLLDDYGRVVGMSMGSMQLGQNLNMAVPVEEIRTGVAIARAILLEGVDRNLVEGEVGFRARYPSYASDVVLDSSTIVKKIEDLKSSGNLTTAWELSLRALEVYPEHGELLFASEQVAFARGDYDACDRLLERLSLTQPNEPRIHNLRGDVLQKRRLFRAAYDAYAQCVVATDPCDYWHCDSRYNQAL
ncbi:MAG: trypsin-like peptidase domain-containing protein, partial [bacterium]